MPTRTLVVRAVGPIRWAVTRQDNDDGGARREARRLLSDAVHGLPSKCLPDAQGSLDEHNDALLVARVIVMRRHVSQ